MNLSEKLFHRNPEFLKSIWLEFSMARVVLMPVILSLVVITALVVGEEARQDHRLLNMIHTFTVLVLIVYGSWLAAQAYLSEVNDNTWIFQRMSSIPAWKMTIGKLFGGTLFAWYGGICGAVVYLVASAMVTKAIVIVSPLVDLLAVFLTALLSQAVCLLAAFYLAERNPIKSRLNSFFSIGVGFVFLVLLGGFYNSSSKVWWGMSVSMSTLYFAFGGAFAVLAILGVHSKLRRELQRGDTPFVFVAFVFTLLTFVMGFQGERVDVPLRTLLPGLALLGFLTVALSVGDNNDVSKFRHLWLYIGRRQWRRVFETVPLWVLSFAIFSLVTVVALVLQTTGGAFKFFAAPVNDWEKMEFAPAKLWLLVLRDVGIVLWLSAALKRRHADLIVFACLTVLYVFLPLIAWASQSYIFFSSFLPVTNPDHHAVISFVVVAIQTGVGGAGYFLHARRVIYSRSSSSI